MITLLQENFQHIRNLAVEIETEVVQSSKRTARLENELAGMFAVTIVATYEGIVRSTLISYAGRHHAKYQAHIEADFAKMNSRISYGDLRGYSRHFGLSAWTDPSVKKNSTTFDRLLAERRPEIERRLRRDLIQSYENLFRWRNSYAHERLTDATLGDVYNSHRVAKYVIKTFADAFELG